MAFLSAEGAVAILDPSPGTRGDSGSVNVQGPAQGEGSRDAKDPRGLPQVVLAAEHYNRILRTLNNKVPVTLEVNVQNRFYDDTSTSSTCSPIMPGTDKADEIVMLGCAFRQLARRHGGDRQRCELRRRHGGDAHPQGVGAADAAHRPRRALDGRGTGIARLARLREGALR